MTTTTTDVARIDGVALHEPQERLSPGELRQRACTRLLLQEARRSGLVAEARRAGPETAPTADPAGRVDASAADLADQADAPAVPEAAVLEAAVPEAAVLDEAEAQAIEALLERELAVAEPDDEMCRRHHAAHRARFGTPERVRARHILFAVTPGVDISALGALAGQILVGLRCASNRDESFAQAARRHSNCPSGAAGGDLGWIGAADCAPEFAREIFARSGADAAVATGILPRLVRSRFGLHIVEVLERDAGPELPWEEVRAAVAADLRRQSWVTALRRYLAGLAARATIEGVDIGSVEPA